jgi:predicted metal-dependent hydrolase
MLSTFFSLFKKKKIALKILKTQGKVFDLQEIYRQINQEYFDARLDLLITWSGNPGKMAQFKRRLGSFDPNTRLIKIHRLLDNACVPEYFINFIVYHEMLHHVFPPKKGKKSRRYVHHAVFKNHEKQFQEYHLAQEWIKKNLHLFVGKRDLNGRP